MDKQITIGIIGASGNVGSRLSWGLAKAGYPVMMFARDQKKLHETRENIVKDTGNKEITEVKDVVTLAQNSKVIFLALPHHQVAEVAKMIRDYVAGKVVVSVSNPLNADYTGLVTGWETSAGEELQGMLPEAKVVKAVNTIFAGRINEPLINGVTIDHFIAGDDQAAVETMMTLAKALGHNPIWVGGLTESRTLEHMAFINISLSMKKMFEWKSAYKLMN